MNNKDVQNPAVQAAIDKIEILIQQAPSNWVRQASRKMKKSESIIRDYASGRKGRRLATGGPIELVQVLKTIIREREALIQEKISE